MPGDTDVLAVLADVVGTPDPMGLLLALEERGVTVTEANPVLDPVAHKANVVEFGKAMEPMWEQANEQRQKMLAQGWSEEQAEHLAGHIVHMWFNVMEANMMGEVAVSTAQAVAEAQGLGGGDD